MSSAAATWGHVWSLCSPGPRDPHALSILSEPGGEEAWRLPAPPQWRWPGIGAPRPTPSDSSRPEDTPAGLGVPCLTMEETSHVPRSDACWAPLEEEIQGVDEEVRRCASLPLVPLDPASASQGGSPEVHPRGPGDHAVVL